MALGRAGPQGP